ncbi:MAG: cupin domain-containing protein [Dehalococcoidia bacterium]|nr:MAG: cupin domain-containing protein [Dehalococcoidia bacterium]
MDHFPTFMKNPANAISASSQSKGVQGYVFDGADGSQMAFWECKLDLTSAEHVHDYEEYFVVVQGLYTLIIDGGKIPVTAGQEYHIPKGVPHAGEAVAGTRTIHAFGGLRAKRKDW